MMKFILAQGEELNCTILRILLSLSVHIHFTYTYHLVLKHIMIFNSTAVCFVVE